MTYAWRHRHVMLPVALAAAVIVASATMLALQEGALRAAALAGGATSGVLYAAVLGVRGPRPRAAAALAGAAVVPAALLALMSPAALLAGIGVACLLVAALWPLVSERQP